MKKRQLGILTLCLVLLVTTLGTKESFARAEEKKIKWIDVTYLLNEWVDCSQLLNQEFIFLTIYYEDGSVVQKQGVEKVYPYHLTPGCQTKIQVEYEGVVGEFFVWGKEETKKSDAITDTAIIEKPSTPTEAVITEKPSATKIVASVTEAPVTPKPYYKMISGQKGIFLTKKAVKNYSVYGKKNINFTFGTNNIKKIEYQFVKKGKKKKGSWKTMKNNQVVFKQQGLYVCYLRFTTLTGGRIIRHTNGFVLDKSDPVILGVKNNQIYHKSVTVSYKDSISGIKKATINGKKLRNKTKIKKNGTYQVEVTDKANNKKRVKFTVNIPVATPKPTTIPSAPPTNKPTPEPTRPPYIPVQSVIAPASVSLEKGKKKQISYRISPSNATDQRVTFTSTNKNIATVSANGTVKGVTPGVASVVIRSKSDSSKYVVCVIYVREKK